MGSLSNELRVNIKNADLENDDDYGETSSLLAPDTQKSPQAFNINIQVKKNSTDILPDATVSPSSKPYTFLGLRFHFDMNSSTTRFVLLTVGVSVFFILNCFVEEYTFKVLPKFEYGWYLTFYELVSFAVFAILERMVTVRNANINNNNNSNGNDNSSPTHLLHHAAPLSRHFMVAVAMTASRGLTNVSLQFLNYPTQIIFKSMKLLAVMIGSLCILNNSYSLSEYCSAMLLVVSACMFSLGDIDVSPSWSVIGVVIVLLSLVADAVHSNTQDSLLREHKSSTNEAMLFTNAFAAVMTLVYVIATGELMPAIRYCQENSEAYLLFTIRSVVIYGGVLCFVSLIKSHGVVVATIVTTVRKIASILLSFLLFPKAWSIKYVFGLLGFVASVAIQISGSKSKPKPKVLPADEPETEQQLNKP